MVSATVMHGGRRWCMLRRRHATKRRLVSSAMPEVGTLSPLAAMNVSFQNRVR